MGRLHEGDMMESILHDLLLAVPALVLAVTFGAYAVTNTG